MLLYDGFCCVMFGGYLAILLSRVHVQNKVWVKPSSEMSYLYGNHVVKAGVARMSEDIPQYGGVVVYSMSNVPLGFGAAAQGTEKARDMDPTGIVVLHQADIGEYLREETSLF
jgi:60S ribosome subunit biogenesis protein NIP7